MVLAGWIGVGLALCGLPKAHAQTAPEVAPTQVRSAASVPQDAGAEAALIQVGPTTQRRAATGAWQSGKAWTIDPARLEAGRRLYEEGRLPSGQPLRATRYGQPLEGASAACVACHRRSGLGSVEGNVQVSPISGRYLFDQDRRAVAVMNLRTIKSFNERHVPYDAATLSAAIRAGRHVSGRELHPMMPRFELSDEDFAILSDYLRQLSSSWSPGVTDRSVRFATVITPDVDPRQKRIFLDTLQATVQQKNGNYVPGQRSMSSASEMMLGTERLWELDVWELTGAPSEWGAQLARRMAARPVFALVSGLGRGHWAPVHEFCEREAVPCWFPSVEAPPVGSQDGRWSVYFSAGVRLEAAVLAEHLSQAGARPRRVRQVVSDDASGQAAAAELAMLLQREGIESRTDRIDLTAPPGAGKPARPIKSTPSAKRSSGSADAADDEVWMYWLRPQDIAALGATPARGPVYFSATLARGETAPFPAAWRSQARLIYPWQLPQVRNASQVYFRQWLRVRQLEMADEFLQTEIYFAMNYLNDTLVDMLDNVHRAYFMERAENMLSLREAARAEDEARELGLVKPQAGAAQGAQPLRPIEGAGDRNLVTRAMTPRPLPGRDQAPTVVRKEGTTLYPRLSLGPGQRLASKGGRIVRFAGPQGDQLLPDSEWIVPLQ